ncbi:unnamed protein product [Phytophthora lilii]|uniref:Unnamed protein product n=1 Tax=Phytophthora lilii TaxID=2077276 RepID=A0A9W7DCY2_9STRA|nr:unnamed protein product [Phytophthora lilii]
MQQVCSRPLTSRSEQRLLKLLQLGDFAPKEEEDRVVNSRLSSKQQSATPTEPTSEIMERNTSILTAAGDEDEDGDEKVELQQMLPSDEQQNLQMPGEIQQEQEEKQQYSRQLRRDDSTTSTDPASDDMDNRGERSLSAPLTPPLQVSTRPFSMSLSTKNMKQVVFEANSGETDLVSLKEGGRDSASSSSDFSSTPERHYFGQIKKCIASIEDLMDSSRKLEIRIREKQAKGATQSS